MSQATRKIISIFMLLWLPLSTGNALAVSLAMQLQQGACHESESISAMSHEAMGDHGMMDHEMMDHGNDMQTGSVQDNPCDSCGACHLACSGYMAVPDADMVAALPPALEATPFLLAWHSFTAVPLVPPPLARA